MSGVILHPARVPQGEQITSSSYISKLHILKHPGSLDILMKFLVVNILIYWSHLSVIYFCLIQT